MRVPRMRFTVRRMMVAVAIASMLLGLSVEISARLCQRALRLRAEADRHIAWLARRGLERAADCAYWHPSATDGPFERASEKSVLWHIQMAENYIFSAHSPWWPAPPDPPEPE
jgi:type II secretory pathway component PulJ